MDSLVDSETAILREEAAHLYQCMMKRPAPEALVNDYLTAHVELPDLRSPPTKQLHSLGIIVSKRLNAVSIEPWLRSRGTRHILTAKLLLLAYLSECDGQHTEFSRTSSGSKLSLVISGLLAGNHLLHGWYMKARHGIL